MLIILHFYLACRKKLFISPEKDVDKLSTGWEAMRTPKKWLSYIHDVKLYFKFV